MLKFRIWTKPQNNERKSVSQVNCSQPINIPPRKSSEKRLEKPGSSFIEEEFETDDDCYSCSFEDEEKVATEIQAVGTATTVIKFNEQIGRPPLSNPSVTRRVEGFFTPETVTPSSSTESPTKKLKT